MDFQSFFVEIHRFTLRNGNLSCARFVVNTPRYRVYRNILGILSHIFDKSVTSFLQCRSENSIKMCISASALQICCKVKHIMLVYATFLNIYQ